jgi:hypothetical protein
MNAFQRHDRRIEEMDQYNLCKRGHSHAWETLPDGTVQCFECDALKSAVDMGRIKTAKKAAASRRNGKLGGRPKTRKRRKHNARD